MDPHRKISCPKGADFFDLWVHDCTQGVKGYLMNFHGPRTRKYLTYRQENFHYRVQNCSLGLYYTQCIFMDPQIKTSWPKGQEVFHYWVHDSTSVSKMSLSKSQCTLMDQKINKSHVESWLLNLMYHSGLFWSTIVHEYQKFTLKLNLALFGISPLLQFSKFGNFI